MNVLLLAPRLPRHPWSLGATARALTDALAQRGHTITLACQAVDDAAMFERVAMVLPRAPFRQTTTDWPMGMGRFARNARRTIAHDVSLSLCRSMSADVWMPLDPTPSSWLAHVAKTRRGVVLPVALAKHAGVLAALAYELFSRLPLGARSTSTPIRRVIAIGPVAAGEAARWLASAGLDDRIVTAPYPGPPTSPSSSLDPVATPAPDASRVRALVRVPADRPLVLISALGPTGRRLEVVFQGLRLAHERRPDRAPLALVLASEAFAAHTQARRAGATDLVRILTPTARIDDCIAAADVVALPLVASRGLFESGASGRLAARALTLGTPLLAVSGTAGYDLCRSGSPTEPAAGWLVDGLTPAAFARAFERISDPDEVQRAKAAALVRAPALAFDRFVDVVESTLSLCARARLDPALDAPT